jgi:hypothetical protein
MIEVTDQQAQLVWEAATRDLAGMANDVSHYPQYLWVSNVSHHPSYHRHLHSRILAMQMEHSADTPLPLRVAAMDAPPADKPKIEFPPGHWMWQLARGLHFLSLNTAARLIEEFVGDYQLEMFDAMKCHKTAGEIRRIMLRHWVGFAFMVLELLVAAIGKVIRMARGL